MSALTAVRTRRSALPLVLLVVALVAVRLWFLRLPLIPDEAGYYQVAQAWTLHGPHLYGHYFVDRPPGLIAMFKVAALTGHILAIRVVGLACAVVAVLAVASAARRMGAAVLPAAAVAAAFVATPVDESVFASSGLYALPWIALSMALFVAAATRVGRSSYLLAAGAGLTAMAAVSVKQNFADGFVFAAVALVVLALRREMPVRRAVLTGLAGVGGAVVGVLAMVLLALGTTNGLHGLWLAAVDFRVKASEVIIGNGPDGTSRRGLEVALVLVVTGMVPLILVLAGRAARHLLRGSAWAWALGVTVLFDLFSIFAGGSYWPHYVLQLAPALGLAVGLAWRPSLPVRLAAALVVLSAVVNLGGYAWVKHHHPEDNNAALGHWVAAAAKPGDTATVLYGHAEIQWATGMRSPYAHLWSLPTRTLDPHLAQLRKVLAGPHAPTWIVQFNPANGWHLDRGGAYRRLLHEKYHRVARVCARPQVWLLKTARRELPPKPGCGARFLEPDWYVVSMVDRLHG